MIKQFSLASALIFSLLASQAQEIRTRAWGGGADEKDLSFGFSFSSVNPYYKIDKAPNWQTPFADPVNGNAPVTGNLTSITSGYSNGFGIGFLARYRLTEFLEARITPSLIFVDKSLTYTYDNTAPVTSPITKTVQATSTDFPLLLKLKSEKIGNFRAYVLGGVQYSHAIGSKSDDLNSAPLNRLVKNVSGYGSYDVGLGCDIYFEFFKMSPEIRLTNSFGDVLVHDNTAFSTPISKLTLHTLMFSLYFE